MSIDRLYSIGFDVKKAIAAVDTFEKRYKGLQSLLDKSFKPKGGVGIASTFNSLGSKFDNVGVKGEQAANKIIAAFFRADNAIRVFRDRLNSGDFKNSAAIKGLDNALKKIGNETTSVGKKVSKFLGDDIKRASDKAGKSVKSLGKKGARTGSDLDRAGRRGSRGIAAIDKSAKTAAFSLTRLATKIAAIFGAFQLIRKTGADFLDFNDNFTAAAAKWSSIDKELQPGTEAFERLGVQIRQLRKDTEFTPTDAAKAADFWAKAGKTAEQTKVVLPVSLDLATAARLNADEAGDILSDALGQFSLDTSDTDQLLINTTRIADVMANAANTANFSVSELFESFKQSGPVMAAAGQSIEQTSAFLAVLANAGIKGSKAGMSLKAVTSSLVAPTKIQSKIYQQLNIHTKDAEGNFLGIADILGQVDKATKKMGSGERLDIFARLVGREGLPGFINLLNKGENVLGDMARQFENVSGKTKELAEYMRQSARAQFQTFLGNISDIGIELVGNIDLFGRLNRALKRVDIEAVSKFINKDLIPAFEKIYSVITNSVIPAFRDVGSDLNQYFGPALRTVTSLLGDLTGHSDGLRTAIKYLIEAFVVGRIFRFATGLGSILGKLNALVPLMSSVAKGGRGLVAALSGLGGLNAVKSIAVAGTIGAAIGTAIAAKFGKEEMVTTAVREAGALAGGSKGTSELFVKSQLSEDPEKINASVARLEEALAYEKSTLFPNEEDVSKLEKALNLITRAKSELNVETFGTDVFVSGGGPGKSRMFNTPEEETGVLLGGMSIDTSIDRPKYKPLDFEPIKGPIDDLNSNIQKQAKQVDEYNRKSLEYQKQMAIDSKSARKGVEQNINIGPTTVNIDAKGGNPEDLERTINRAMDRRDRQQRASIKGAASSLTAGAY